MTKMSNSQDDITIQFGMEVVAHVSGRKVTGRVMSTSYLGTELLSIGFYSPELGHINRIDDAIVVQAYDIIGPADR
jgi:hypothetical protein